MATKIITNSSTIKKIKAVRNPDNKPLERLIKEAMEEEDKKSVTIYDLKKGKFITDKWEKFYLDWLILKIISSYFEEVYEYSDPLMRKLEWYERKGYYIEEYVLKLNDVMNKRMHMRKWLYNADRDYIIE